jgi:chromosome segregation protein
VRLTRLELHGFKSFADATELVFDQGVTAIVGPNGCGKSNVSDAVRWVLGEQRARLLRGAKMEEVIFQGSSARRPVNVAQVSLHFDNTDGDLQVPYTEVVVARRLSRSGESEYLLNNTPCRLRDIQDLLLGTGLGADAGVVIEARMIDALLSDRPDERRELFEEAAGVSLYRDRRRTTERRLEETSHDLQRLDDLLIEKTTLVRSLARQRKRAERHAELMKRRLALELTLAEHEMEASSAQLEALSSQLRELRDTAPTLQTRVADAERARDAAHRARESAEAARTELARLTAEQHAAVANTERDLAVADSRNTVERRQRAEAERDAEAMAGARDDEQLAQAQVDRAAADATVARTEDDVRARMAAEDAARASLNDARAALESAERAVRGTREALHRLELDRDAAIREQQDIGTTIAQLAQERPPIEEALAHAREMVASATASAERARAEALAADAAFAAASAAAKAARESESIALSGVRTADDNLTSLRGRAQSLEALERERVGLAPAAAKLLRERARFGADAVVGPISDFVRADAGAALLVERFLGATIHAVVVRDGAAAEAVREWHAETQPGALLLLPMDAAPETQNAQDDLASRVSVDGAVGRWVRALLGHVRAVDAGTAFRDARGAIWLPGETGGAGPLRRRAELHDLQQQVAAAEVARAAATESAAAASAALATAETTLREALATVERAGRARHEADARLAEAQAAHNRAQRALNDIEALRERHEQRRISLVGRVEADAQELQQTAALLAERSAAVAAAHAAVTAAERALDDARADHTRAAVANAEANAQRRVVVARAERLTAERATHDERLAALAAELASLSSLDEALATRRADAELRLRSQRGSLAELESRLAEAEARVRHLGQEVLNAEHALDTARADAASAAGALHHAELQHQEVLSRQSLVRERLEAEWRRPLSDLYQGHEPVAGDPEALRAEAEEIRAQIEAVGLVNPLAVEEHQEEQQRLDFLQRQRSDLADAQRSLQQAIREIDLTARELFLSTFAHIRENFRHIFLTLFGGGDCDIRLADPDAPLDCDIEIHASPRGKRTQRIHLLSSGERALVALSLLFGIFLTKPSPFCLLDEVDAPLDDANIGGYVRMLTEFKQRTQFIVITHNPRTTTEAADAVYGVTMQEPGVSSVVAIRMRGGPPVDDAAA